MRAKCLETAREAVCVGRQVAHGNPEDTFGRIANLWNAYLCNAGQAKLGAHDVALMLDLMKTARLQGNPGHFDSWVDKAGYAACGCEIGCDDGSD